jgi:ribose transport system substrate-binding protein
MKKHYKIAALVVLVVAVFGLLSACSQTADQPAPAASESAAPSESVSQAAASGGASAQSESAAAGKDAKDIKIGFLAMNRSMTWMQYALKGAQSAADELGVELVVYDAENDVSKQTSMMEDLITQQVDAIITDPINVESLSPAVKEAADAGIPVVTFDRRCEGAPYTAFVGCDDVLGGKLAAQFINEKLNGQGKIVEIVGAAGASPTIDRGNGFQSELKNYPGLEIVYSQTGEFTREKGMSVMEDAISTVGSFDAVFSYNDDMMMGALQAMKDANMDLSKIVTISYDGIPDALKSIQDGDHDATIQYPSAQAGQALKKAVEYIQSGKDPEKKDELIQPWVITKDNLDSGDFFGEISK